VAVVVCEAVPGFHPSGSNHVLEDLLAFLGSEGLEAHFVLYTRGVNFFVAGAGQLPYVLHARGVRRIGGRFVALSPRLWPSVLFARFFGRLPVWAQKALMSVRGLTRRLRRVDHVIGRYLTPEQSEFVLASIRDIDPDLIFYDKVFSLPHPERILAGAESQPAESRRSSVGAAGAREYIITQDAKYARFQSFKASGFRVLPRAFTRETETALLSAVPNIIAIQWEEAETFRNMVPGANVIVVPPSMPPRPAREQSAIDPFKCIFVGSASLQNVEGIEWFLGSVWPLVRRLCPRAHLHVYGSVCSRIRSVPEAVTLWGVVDRIEGAYEDAAVCAVSLRAGAGMKVKLVEALSFGVASVTTSVGAQGFLDLPADPYVLADEADEFAQAVADLLQSSERRRALEAKAREASEFFMFDNAFAELRSDVRSFLSATDR